MKVVGFGVFVPIYLSLAVLLCFSAGGFTFFDDNMLMPLKGTSFQKHKATYIV